MVIVFGAIVPTTIAQDDPREVVYKQAMSEDGLLTFAYPEDWFIDSEALSQSAIGVLSDERILEASPDDPLESGQITIFMRLIDTEAAAEQGIVGEALEERLTAYTEILSAFTDADDNLFYEFGEMTFVETHPLVLPYAQVVYTNNDNEFRMILWDVADGLTGIAIIRTAEREWILYEQIATTVVLSLQYLGDEYEPVQLAEEEDSE